MKIFVTGFHRAGTHSAAEHFARKHKVFYFEEGRIRWNSLEAATSLASGYSPKWNSVNRICECGWEGLDTQLKQVVSPEFDREHGRFLAGKLTPMEFQTFAEKHDIKRICPACKCEDVTITPLNVDLKGIRDPNLDKGFSLQCPGLAHETEELSKHGKVYFITRTKEHIINSMKNASMNNMVWDLVANFKSKFPDDPVWPLLVYEGGDDVHCSFVGYYTLFVNLKEYFFDKYLSGFAEKIVAEDQPYYKPEKSLSVRKPPRPREKKMIDKYQKHWEAVYDSLRKNTT